MCQRAPSHYRKIGDGILEAPRHPTWDPCTNLAPFPVFTNPEKPLEAIVKSRMDNRSPWRSPQVTLKTLRDLPFTITEIWAKDIHA